MLGTKKGIVLALGLGLAQAGSAIAEPSYLVYPASVPTVFRYDVGRYEVVGPDQAKFDPQFAVGNYMLWDKAEERVPVEVYGAPQLAGFEPTVGTSEFVTYNDAFDLIVDGFGPGPRTIGNLCLRFWPYSAGNTSSITVDGVVTGALTVRLPDLEVTTPLENGYYAGTSLHHVSWTGGQAMEIVAFSDKDNDGGFQGTPAYRIVSRHTPVATESTSWGRVKALYRR
jgi:hypothetical protein